ncbi:MAG: hypothetical protein FWG10_06610 [Eubacteriaceae bacterium]|nr:hypothetical protein [Eubacteriaceae bacterium]
MGNVATQTNKMKKASGMAAIALCIVFTIANVGCASKSKEDLAPANALQEKGWLDSRASAANTFGGNMLDTFQVGGQKMDPAQAAAQAPGNTLMGFGEYMASFKKHSEEFATKVGTEMAKANQFDIIRLDTLSTTGLFSIMAVWEENPDNAIPAWESMYGEGNWALQTEEVQGFNHLLFSNNNVPTAEFFGNWNEAKQYFYGVFNTSSYTLEIDIARTGFGFACQLYEPKIPAVYRLAFSDDGNLDGSIGYTFEIGTQPALLTGNETLDFGMEWSEVGLFDYAYAIFKGDKMTVAYEGGAQEFNITSQGTNTNQTPGQYGNINPVTGQPIQPSNNGQANQAQQNLATANLSAQAAPYARLWHGTQVMGADWSERFCLYADGSFIWGANMMDGKTRIRYLTGTWDVKNSQLLLNTKVAFCWEGGQMAPNTGGYTFATSEVVLNPTVVAYQTDEQLVIPLGAISYDAMSGMDTAVFNELQCWDYSGREDEAMADFWETFILLLNRSSSLIDDKISPKSAF